MRILSLAALALISFLMVFTPSSAQAGWPSWETVLDKLAPFIFTNPDQYEATKFAIKNPSCAMTIVSYTAAQDYSLVGFIGTLKATNLKTVPKFSPINSGNCKSMQPVRMAYEFIDRKGDEYLGKANADFFRNLLADQIAEGKEAIDAQIASIPYLGPIIQNWDCECDAAFTTKFQLEKLADDIVGTAISIIKSVIAGSYGEALEKMVTKLGPPVACKLGAEFTGIGSIPVVSTFASQACDSVAGKAVEWVVTGVGDAAEALGIVGGEHIPPDQYYNDVMRIYVGNSDYLGWADVLYGKCYNYFEPSNMAPKTAKKVCAQLRARYVEDSMGSIQWNAFQLDRFKFYQEQAKPKAISSAMLSDAEFDTIKKQIEATCNSYFGQKYPLADKYWNAYSKDKTGTTTAFCHDIVTTESKFDKDMDVGSERAKAQLTLMYNLQSKLTPLCSFDAKSRNVMKCQNGQGLDNCKQNLAKACEASTDPVLGGKAFPCCEGGAQPSDIEKMNAEAISKLAKKVGEPYCFTEAKDPLRIICTLPDAYKRCQNAFQWFSQKDCSTANKTGIGLMAEACCSLDESRLPEVKGVTETKAALDKLNGVYKDATKPATTTQGAVKDGVDAKDLQGMNGKSLQEMAGKSTDAAAKALANSMDPKEPCSLGGTFIAPSSEVRVINCAASRVEECKTTLGNSSACTLNGSGYASRPCCEIAPFGGSTHADDKGFDCTALPKEDKDYEAAAKAVNDSKGNCVFGKDANGKTDLFRVICINKKAYDACIKQLGAGAQRLGSCAKALCSDGTAYTPCCDLDKALYGNITLEDMKKDVAKAAEKGVKGLDPAKMFENMNGGGDKKKEGKPRKGAPVGDGSILDIKLLKSNNKGGVDPFNAKVVRERIGPQDVAAPVETGMRNKKGDGSKVDNPADAAAPRATPDAPSVTRRTAPAAVIAPTAGFSCDGQPNGMYCKSADVLVFCYMNGEASSQNCPAGCDATAKACNPYKP